MNRQKLLIGVVVAFFTLAWGMEIGYAQQYDPAARLAERLTHNKIRKDAAKRLLAKAEKVRHERLFNTDGTPKGYKANGYSGEGKNGNKKIAGGL